MPINISRHSDIFRRYLSAGWDVFDELLHIHNWDDNPQFAEQWVSTVWSKFVIEQNSIGESSVLEYSFPTNNLIELIKERDFVIVCRNKKHNTGMPILIFCEFLDRKDGRLGVYPPFSLIRAINLDSREDLLVDASQFDLYIENKSELGIPI